jgi:hypothetical protein
MPAFGGFGRSVVTEQSHSYWALSPKAGMLASKPPSLALAGPFGTIQTRLARLRRVRRASNQPFAALPAEPTGGQVSLLSLLRGR